jgi:hypothetical protein
MTYEHRMDLAYGTEKSKHVAHWVAREQGITWGQFCGLLRKPGDSKAESSSYVLGQIVPGPGVKCKCTEYLHRTKHTVVSRSAITLDADGLAHTDDPCGEKLEQRLLRIGCAAVLHTTWSHQFDAARLRIIVPLNRRVGPLEYAPITRLLMVQLAPNNLAFDKTCDQASRLMYMPSAPNPNDYYLRLYAGDPLDADIWLDWAGGPAEPKQYRRKTTHAGLTKIEVRQLEGLCKKVAYEGEGNRDSLLFWAMLTARDTGMDPDIAMEKLIEAGVYAGLEENICIEKAERVFSG